MRLGPEGEVPPLRGDTGERWRAQAPPEDVRRRLRRRLQDLEGGERGYRRNALMMLAAILLLVFVASRLERATPVPATGLRLDLRSGNLHLVWVQAGQAGGQR
jgi:hypothetical protein